MAAVATAVPVDEPVRAQPAMPAVSTVIQTPAADERQTMSTLQLLFTALWLFLGFAGFVIFLGGLSGMQDYVKDSKNTSRWTIPANFPYLTPHHVFRWDWWVIFGGFVVWCLVVIILAIRRLLEWRCCLMGLLTAFAVLYAIEADRFYNARTFVSYDHDQWNVSNCAFSGALIGSTAFFMLLFCLGVDPESWPF